MSIVTIPSGLFKTNVFIITCPLTRRALIVDPAPNSFSSLSHYIKKNSLTVDAIVITHSHWDHIADAALVKTHYNAPLFVHAADAENLQHPGSDKIPCPLSFAGVTADTFLDEGDILPVGSLSFRIIHTPGHTPGSICLYSADENTLITGDTLFKGSIGNLSFSTSDPSKMWSSLKKLIALPSQTAFFPGHGKPSRLCDEHWLSHAQELFDLP